MQSLQPLPILDLVATCITLTHQRQRRAASSAYSFTLHSDINCSRILVPTGVNEINATHHGGTCHRPSHTTTRPANPSQKIKMISRSLDDHLPSSYVALYLFRLQTDGSVPRLPIRCSETWLPIYTHSPSLASISALSLQPRWTVCSPSLSSTRLGATRTVPIVWARIRVVRLSSLLEEVTARSSFTRSRSAGRCSRSARTRAWSVDCAGPRRRVTASAVL